MVNYANLVNKRNTPNSYFVAYFNGYFSTGIIIKYFCIFVK